MHTFRCIMCPIFRISGTTGRTALKLGVWLEDHQLCVLHSMGDICTSARVTVTHLSTSIRSRSSSPKRRLTDPVLQRKHSKLFFRASLIPQVSVRFIPKRTVKSRAMHHVQFTSLKQLHTLFWQPEDGLGCRKRPRVHQYCNLAEISYSCFVH